MQDKLDADLNRWIAISGFLSVVMVVLIGSVILTVAVGIFKHHVNWSLAAILFAIWLAIGLFVVRPMKTRMEKFTTTL